MGWVKETTFLHLLSSSLCILMRAFLMVWLEEEEGVHAAGGRRVGAHVQYLNVELGDMCPVKWGLIYSSTHQARVNEIRASDDHLAVEGVWG